MPFLLLLKSINSRNLRNSRLVLVSTATATTAAARGTLRGRAAFRQFGAGLGIGLHIVGIIAQVPDAFPQLVHIRVFCIKSDGDFRGFHVVGALLHARPLRNVLHHDFLALFASSVCLDCNGLCFNLLLCQKGECHCKQDNKREDFFHKKTFFWIKFIKPQQKYIIFVKCSNVFYEKS